MTADTKTRLAAAEAAMAELRAELDELVAIVRQVIGSPQRTT